MGEDCLSCLTCVLSFCLFEQYNMFKVMCVYYAQDCSVLYSNAVLPVMCEG